MAGLSKENYLGLLRSADFSDLVIESGDTEFKVHKAIVCTASSGLREACVGVDTKARFLVDEFIPQPSI
jgi:hypothetical protein